MSWTNVRIVQCKNVLINLALQDDIGCGPREGCCPSDAGSITHTQAHAFGQFQVLLLPLVSPLLRLLWTPSASL